MTVARILALSDTHFTSSSGHLSEEITSHFDEVDFIVHSGDYTDISLVKHLEQTGKFVGVSGNMDPAEIKQILPEINDITLDDIKIGIIHGWGAPKGIVERIHPICKEHGFSIVIFGHTHNKLESEHEGIKYFNPGSPVDKMFARENSFLILEVSRDGKTSARFIPVS